jgi:hypothetical protein
MGLNINGLPRTSVDGKPVTTHVPPKAIQIDWNKGLQKIWKLTVKKPES